MDGEFDVIFIRWISLETIDYLDVLPVPQLLSLRVRIRRNNLGGGTFRVECRGFLLRSGLRLDLWWAQSKRDRECEARGVSYRSNIFHGIRFISTEGFGSRKLHLCVKQVSSSYLVIVLVGKWCGVYKPGINNPE